MTGGAADVVVVVVVLGGGGQVRLKWRFTTNSVVYFGWFSVTTLKIEKETEEENNFKQMREHTRRDKKRSHSNGSQLNVIIWASLVEIITDNEEKINDNKLRSFVRSLIRKY